MQKLRDNNPKLDLVNDDLVRFCQFVLKILSGNKILMSITGRNSVNFLQQMTGNNPKLDLVNVDVHTTFGQILSIRSQDIARKRNYDFKSRNSGNFFRKMTVDNPKLDLVNVDVHTKFGQILSIHSQDIEKKTKF